MKTDTYYLHRTQLNFYCDSVFGPRRIEVVDPEWTPPVVYVPDPDWSPDADNLSASAPNIEMPDPDAIPPLISVPNPACKLPPEHELLELSEALYLELSHASAAGKVVVLDEDGVPCLVDRPPPSLAQQAAGQRQWRDRLLLSTDTLIVRHRDETEAGRLTTLGADQYRALQGFRMDLRDWPESEAFPDATRRPVEPDWLADYLA